MLKREEIKDKTLVYYDNSEDYYGYLTYVGNAREKGDRGESSTPEDELSYSMVDIISDKVIDGICQNSGFNDSLRVATVEEIDIYLNLQEAIKLEKIAKAMKKLALIRSSINKFQKIKNEKGLH